MYLDGVRYVWQAVLWYLSIVRADLGGCYCNSLDNLLLHLPNDLIIDRHDALLLTNARVGTIEVLLKTLTGADLLNETLHKVIHKSVYLSIIHRDTIDLSLVEEEHLDR